MNRFKAKMNGVEMKMLAMVTVNVARSINPVVNIQELVSVDVMERIWSRMRNMYRPDKDRYTVQFSSVEAMVITDYIVPAMMTSDDAVLMSFGSRIRQELYNQVNRECNIYNAMNYGR